MQGLRAVTGLAGGLADEGRVSTRFEDDQGMFHVHSSAAGETHQAEKWRVDLHALRDVEQSAPCPEGGVQGGEGVVARRDGLREQVLLDEFRVLFDRRVEVEVDHSRREPRRGRAGGDAVDLLDPR